MITRERRRPAGLQSAVVGRILVVASAECVFLAIGFLTESQGMRAHGDGDYERKGADVFWEAYLADGTPIDLAPGVSP